MFYRLTGLVFVCFFVFACEVNEDFIPEVFKSKNTTALVCDFSENKTNHKISLHIEKEKISGIEVSSFYPGFEGRPGSSCVYEAGVQGSELENEHVFHVISEEKVNIIANHFKAPSEIVSVEHLKNKFIVDMSKINPLEHCGVGAGLLDTYELTVENDNCFKK
jgi:hypothetical protein